MDRHGPRSVIGTAAMMPEGAIPVLARGSVNGTVMVPPLSCCSSARPRCARRWCRRCAAAGPPGMTSGTRGGFTPATSSTILVLMAWMNSARSRTAITKARGRRDAILVILVQILDIEGVGIGPLQHQGQAIDGDALRHQSVAGLVHAGALVVHAVARDIDDLPQGAILPCPRTDARRR